MKGVVARHDDPSYPPGATVAYVSFATLHDEPLTVAGELRLPPPPAEPRPAEPLPAVLLLHGSAGVDGRGERLARALNEAGVATLEIDMWAPRGLAGGLARPSHPAETLPDAFGALRYLATRGDIDPRRIGVAGFSWGGVVSMLSATRRYASAYQGVPPLRFAAHAPFYPVCWFYNRVPGYEFGDLTGAPVFLQAGELDAYDEPDGCEKMVAALEPLDRRHLRVRVYPGATHAFDRLQAAVTVRDPHAHEGRGGEVDFVPNPAVADESRRATVAFFAEALAPARS